MHCIDDANALLVGFCFLQSYTRLFGRVPQGRGEWSPKESMLMLVKVKVLYKKSATLLICIFFFSSDLCAQRKKRVTETKLGAENKKKKYKVFSQESVYFSVESSRLFIHDDPFAPLCGSSKVKCPFYT